MGTTVTPEQVWEAINKDPQFASQPSEMRKAAKPFVLAMPEVLKDHLDKDISLETYFAVKIDYIKYLLAGGWLGKLLGKSDLVELLSETLQSTIETLEEYLKAISQDKAAFLDDFGVTEQELMLAPNVGFNEEARAAYLAGTLTVNQLLVIQPMIIYDNSKH